MRHCGCSAGSFERSPNCVACGVAEPPMRAHAVRRSASSGGSDESRFSPVNRSLSARAKLSTSSFSSVVARGGTRRRPAGRRHRRTCGRPAHSSCSVMSSCLRTVLMTWWVQLAWTCPISTVFGRSEQKRPNTRPVGPGPTGGSREIRSCKTDRTWDRPRRLATPRAATSTSPTRWWAKGRATWCSCGAASPTSR